MIAPHGDLFDAARAALDEGDAAEAEALARQGLAACERAKAPPSAQAPGYYVLAALAADAGDDAAALELADRARALDPAYGEAAHLAAHLRLSRWDLDGAEAVLAACRERPAQADILYLRGTIAELDHRFEHAEAWYERAAALDPENHPEPERIDHDEIEAMVRETIAAMPADVVATFGNLTIDVLEVPDRHLHADIHPETLGLYAGTPVGDSEAMPIALPDRVFIFKRNLERLARDREHLREELRITLLHELGHHLGWDEDDLEERGLA